MKKWGEKEKEGERRVIQSVSRLDRNCQFETMQGKKEKRNTKPILIGHGLTKAETGTEICKYEW